jgi:hypothetical protein
MGLVDDQLGLRTKDVLVPAPVVTAEEQVDAPRKDHAHVGLSLAAITAVLR